MNKGLVWIKSGLVLVFLLVLFFFYGIYFGSPSENDERELLKDVDIRKLPTLNYDEKSVDKLFEAVSLKELYKNKNQ